MIVKRFGCTTIHNKALYKCFHSFIHSFISFIAKYLNVEQRAHWLPIQERTNQLDCHVIMMSLCHIELDLSDCAI